MQQTCITFWTTPFTQPRVWKGSLLPCRCCQLNPPRLDTRESEENNSAHRVRGWGSPSRLTSRSRNGLFSLGFGYWQRTLPGAGRSWVTLSNSQKFLSAIACNEMSPPRKERWRQATLNFTNRLSDNLAPSIHARESSSKQPRQAVSFDICSCFSTGITLLGYPVFSCCSTDAISYLTYSSDLSTFSTVRTGEGINSRERTATETSLAFSGMTNV